MLVRFYQVAGEGPGVVDAVLPVLLEKALSVGERVGVVCPTAQRVTRLDEGLWGAGARTSFLPHGVEGAGFEEHQPILLGEKALEGRLPVILAGCEGVLRESQAEKVLYVFDSSDVVLKRAREVWKDLKGKAELEYWAQSDGRWGRKG